MKVKKTFRIEENIVSKLERYAKEKSISQTEVIETAIHNAIHKPDDCHACPAEESESETDWRALYFAEKERNDSMSAKLIDLSDKVVDSLQAAQVLQAMDKPVLESSEQKGERESRWQRLKKAFMG